MEDIPKIKDKTRLPLDIEIPKDQDEVKVNLEIVIKRT